MIFRSAISFLIFLALTIFSARDTFAQYPGDPSLNLTVCDTTGEQALSKIISTSDGGAYISWFDSRSGSYHMYLQKLDVFGNRQWGNNGLLISSNPQSTSLVDYDLTVDQSGNAILVFSDTRNSGNLNPVAYKISPSGVFEWGANGVTLNPASDFQPNPKVVATSDGNIAVCWIVATTPFKIAVQKLSPTGDKLWGASPVLISSASEGYNYPSIIKSDNGSVIVIHTVTTGSFPAQTVKIRATKFNSDGTPAWGSGGIMIQDLGRIAAFHNPKVISDGNNGGIVAWHDDRDMDNVQSAFVQRISSSGTLSFPVNGAEGSLLSGRNKFNPAVSFDHANQETYIFWLETNSTQNQHGISGQKFSSSGIRQWTDNGKVFMDLSSPNTASVSSINSQMGQGRNFVVYLLGNGSGVNQKVEGFAVDGSGNFLWTGNMVTISNPTSEKLQMVSAVDIYGNCKMSWGDRRSGNQGIYAQDVNPTGQLGNSVIPVELISFSAFVENNIVTLNWVTASEINNLGFDIERKSVSNRISQSADNEWNVIGFVPGRGTTTEQSVYYFNDEPASGGYLYRLKQMDFDGTFSYSGEVRVEKTSPAEFILANNYPNPFNPETRITFSLPAPGNVKLTVFDVLGQEVAILVSGHMEVGTHSIIFNASGLNSGVYLYKLESGNYVNVKKMILNK